VVGDSGAEVRDGKHTEKWRLTFLCDLLAANPPLLPSRCQLPVAFGVNVFLPSGEHIPRRDVADGTVQADVVVMFDVTLRRCASPSESGVPGLMHSLFSDLCQRSIFPFDCG
jgi:hypothetical protein